MSIALTCSGTKIPNFIPKYFPSSENLNNDEDIREVMLRLLQDEHILPFTKEDAEIFTNSTKTSKWADWCVSKWGYAVGIFVPLGLTLVSLNVFNTSKKEDALDPMVIATTLLVVGFSNAWSMYATGDVTAKSSAWGNAEQNVLAKIQKSFENLGDYMLLQYESPQEKERMIACARSINENMAQIYSRLLEATTQKGRVDLVFQGFRDTIQYIGFKKDPVENSELQMKIRNMKFREQYLLVKIN